MCCIEQIRVGRLAQEQEWKQDGWCSEIRASGRCPKNLQTDMGKEFYNADVQKILKKHDVNHYSTYLTLKASVVEQFNCMLKNDMWKMLIHNGNYK